ncbi:penicillin-binding protein activator [Rhodobacteraceae bacterium WD3A24]|nr:penicillin-binding protein activator [Rhodobacteraceae bacterium WD3A24]
MFAFLTAQRKAPRRRATAPLALVATLGLLVAACAPGEIGLSPGGGGARLSAQETVDVALLVPGGSGDSGNDALARNLENAARMAVADLGTDRIELRVYDTAGRPERAGEVARRAAADGADIILGPVFSGAARAAGQAVADHGINVLSFSNNPEVAGGNVFVLGPTFANTARRLLAHAGTQEIGRVAVVQERTNAGDVGRRAVEDAARATGVRVATVESFEFSQQGVVDALSDMVEGIRESGARAVVFTSDSAGALPLVTQLLSENRVDPEDYQYIGLTRWDVPASTLEERQLQGGWFAMPDPDLAARFRARYESRYGSAPETIAGLGYDGIAAIGALLESRGGDALTRASLTQPSGFAGVNGVFRLLPDGTNERALAVATIRDNEVSVIDPAPRSFGAAGF